MLFKDGIKISPQKAQSVGHFESPLSIFESLRTYGGIPFKIDEHLARLQESARTAGFQLPTALEHIRKELSLCLAQVPKGEYFIRITMTPDSVLMLFAPQKKYPPSIYKEGVQVSTVPTVRHSVRSSFPPAKTSNFLNQILGTLDSVGRNSFEVIFKGVDGMLQEARTWNFFIVKDGILKTPPVVGSLGGVTRKFVIELAAFLRIRVEETPLTRHEVYNADEAFLTNTSGEIVPIRAWDGRKIGSRIPGSLTRKLVLEYRKQVKHETTGSGQRL